MSEQSFDVIICGAGPAGLSAALNLLGTNLTVALIDKDSFPREKICGDALSASVMDAMKRFPGNIYQGFLDFPHKTPSNGIRFIAPDQNFVDVPFSPGEHQDNAASGYICKRSDFDNFLLEKVKGYEYHGS